MLSRSALREALLNIARRSPAEKKSIPHASTAPRQNRPSTCSSQSSDSRHRERAPDRDADFFRGYSPHAFAPDRAFTKIAGMTWNLAADRQLRKPPRRRSLSGGGAPHRHHRASDSRRDMHRARVGSERGVALRKDRD